MARILGASLLAALLVLGCARLPAGSAGLGPSPEDVPLASPESSPLPSTESSSGPTAPETDPPTVPPATPRTVTPCHSFAPRGLWSATGPLLGPRHSHLAVRLQDGRVLVAGGQTEGLRGPEAILASAELFDPACGSWSRTGDMLGRRNTGDIFLLADGRVLVVGGSTPEPIFTVAEIYDPATGTWASAWPVERLPEGAMVVHLADGRLLVAGGSFVDSSAAYLATAQLNDPMTGAWWTTASMPKACVYCDGLVLSDGRVLVIGGFSDDGYTMGLLYDPTAGRWSVTTPPSQPGPLAALLLLRNGQALALHESPSAAEVYDPEAGTWTKVASRMTAGDLRTATVLADGRVLVTVADIYSDAQPPSWAEIYDRALGSWIFGETMTTHRVFHSATLLADGRVLVAGDSTRGEQTHPAEIFDPAALR